jgi:1-acyl-sn-glycerol-3-phosphate acyltransferase
MSSNTTGVATRVWRLIRIGWHIAYGIATATVLFPWLPHPQRTAHIRHWSARLLHILAVRLVIVDASTPASASPPVIVANHVSWLDVYALNAVRPSRFVAKSEIRAWPVLGWFSRRAGTLFIERARLRDVLKVNNQISTLLEQGESIAVFPEGTTTDGTVVLPFRPALLQPAVAAGADVQAVALRYTRADGSVCSEVDYTADRSLVESIALALTQPVIHAHLQFLTPLATANLHRREVARNAQIEIARVLGVPAPLRNQPRADNVPLSSDSTMESGAPVYPRSAAFDSA